MRVILSRKGFDSNSGGGPSPILPDGSMVSLPIPDGDGTVRYADLAWDSRTVLELLHELGYSRFDVRSTAHLDPDLVAARYPRQPGWQALFGQTGAAASHLMAQHVGVGDLFLFWGLFCHTRRTGGRLRFVGQAFHTIYGYLEVARVLAAGAGEWIPSVPEFPHFRKRYLGTNCRVYVAQEHLSGTGLPGYGVFAYEDRLRLTAPEAARRTDWQLPACFHPESGASLSYHSAAERWEPLTGRVARLSAAARGQEFVASPCDGISGWARGLITAVARPLA